MPSQNVDLVFVVDASESMQPCFDALRTHLDKVIQPMQGYVSKVRFGLVAQSAGSVRGQPVYDHQFLCGSGMDAIKKLYQKSPNDPDPRNEFFTDDTKKFSTALTKLKAQGNEEMLVALDIAADFPFGSLSNTKRVIALFSDEPFEKGVALGALNKRIPELAKKLMDRHIQLFMAVPESGAANDLAMVDRSEVEFIDGGNGLKNVDFKQLLGQMGKSISGSSQQSVAEPAYQRALFGQTGWNDKNVASLQMRDKIGRAGEIGGIAVQALKLGVLLDVSPSMSPYIASLRQQIRSSFPDAAYREVDGCGLYNDKEDFKKCYFIPALKRRGNLPAGISVEMLAELALADDEIRLHQEEQLKSMRFLSDLIRSASCDAIYWFCDLQDGGSPEAIDTLRRSLSSAQVRLYVRSLDQGSEEYPDFDQVIKSSGGELRRGNIHELM